MSYTTKIKEEIASIENTKSEMIAELAGFIRNIVGGGILYWLAGIFSLSGMLSTVIGWVSDLMMGFWQLIPFLKI